VPDPAPDFAIVSVTSIGCGAVVVKLPTVPKLVPPTVLATTRN